MYAPQHKGLAMTCETMTSVEIIEGIERGLADVDAGRIVPHADVMAEAREIIRAAKRSPAFSDRTDSD